jgi:phosphoglycolate phosphatase-like HAD superfamily hydrolase
MSNLLIDDRVELHNINAVIFDKDGTLIDIHHYWSSIIKIRAFLVAKKWFKKKQRSDIEEYLIDIMGVNLNSGRMKPDGPVGVMPRSYIVSIVADFIRKNDPLITNRDVERLFKNADLISLKDISSFIRVLPGVEELLVNLKESDIDSIIVSNDITIRAKMAMEAVNLEKYFTEIIGGDLAKKAKPEPELALLALSVLKLNAKNVAIIGDHPFDIMMGTAVNSGLNIGVLTGLSSSTDQFNNLDCIVVDNLKHLSVS